MSSILNWISGSAENENVLEFSAFSAFPIQLYEAIFELLDLESKLNCRLVCFPWYTLLNQHFLRNKIVTAYKDVSCLSVLLKPFKLRGSQLYGNYLRIENIHYFDQYSGLILWISTTNTRQFQQLELRSCILTVPIIRFILFRFENLTSLTISDVYLSPIFLPGEEFSKLKLQNLKELDISTKNSHDDLRTPPCIAIDWLVEICRKLEVFKLKVMDTGHPELDGAENGTFFAQYFVKFCTVLQRNSSTLKEVNFSTYDLQEASKLNHITQSASGLPRRGAHALFLRFITELGQNQWNWTTLDFPLLTKFGLRFRLALIDQTIEYEGSFIPFLSRMTQLKEFELSQIYSQKTYFRDNMQVLFQCLPPRCKCKIETLHSLRADIELNAATALVVYEIKRLDFEQYKIYIPSRESAFQIMDLDSGDPGYNDSIGFFQIGLVQWTILYGRWRRIQDQEFPNLKYMTKIKIQQPGIYLANKLVIDDSAMQYIIQEGANLSHVIMEHVNCAQLTDFGLTGLNRDALTRIGLAIAKGEDTEIQPGDSAGFPISHLKGLSVMILSCVGQGVTGISCQFAFGPDNANILMQRNKFLYVKRKPTESWMFNYPIPSPSSIKSS